MADLDRTHDEHMCWRCLREGTRAFRKNPDVGLGGSWECAADKACQQRREVRSSPQRQASRFLDHQPSYGHFGAGCYS